MEKIIRVMDERFVMAVSERDFEIALGDFMVWHEEKRHGAAERFARCLKELSVNRAEVAWRLLSSYGGDHEAMMRERKRLMRLMKKRLGRNFVWREGLHSWGLIEAYAVGHREDMMGVMEVVSWALVLEWMEVWEGWHLAHLEDN